MSGEELEGETRASEPDGKRGRPCLNGAGSGNSGRDAMPEWTSRFQIHM